MGKIVLKFIFVITIILYAFTARGQSALDRTLSGYVYDASSGEKLISATVYDFVKESGTISNTYGFYSYTTSSDSILLSISYVGYSDVDTLILISENLHIDIPLQPQNTISEIEIIAEKSIKIQEESSMSTVDVSPAQIKKIPALLGEVDVIKALQLLPGVQSGGEGQSGLYVRGGSPDQNLILLDGVPVYNASHLFGFFSVFNADAIKDVKLIKGGYPARYGGRLSSILEINMKEGSNKEIKGSGSIGLVASKITVEGPIKSENTSFIVSARRTYIDLLAKPFIKSSFSDSGEEGGTGYYFYDLNAKINHKFSDKDRLFFGIYRGRDRFYFDTKEKEGDYRDEIKNDFAWGNITTSLRWNHQISPKMFLNTTAYLSDYQLNTSASFGTEYLIEGYTENISLDYISGVRDYAMRVDLDYVPSPSHYIKVGANNILHKFNPGTFDLAQSNTRDGLNFSTQIKQTDVSAYEYNAYAEDDIVLTDKLKANVGLHFSGVNVNGANYTSLQPRLSARYLINPLTSIKFSFASMRQYIHLLAFEGIGLPTDLWVPTTAKVKPQDSYQLALGAAHSLNDSYEISLEAYYRSMSNVISYKDGSGLFEITDWQDRVTQGDGEAYGVELLVQKKLGRLSGWVGYTLAWSNRTFEDLNFGETFPFRYDRRHDISIVASYDLSKRFSLSGTWVYGSGNAITLANSEYASVFKSTDTESYFSDVSFFEDRNDFRMNSYHRFDIGLNFTKKKKRYTRTWSIGAYNAYNRNNPFFLYYDRQFDANGNSQTKLQQVSLFPIIPYINFSFDF